MRYPHKQVRFMKVTRSIWQISLGLVSGILVSASPAHAQQGPMLDLDYGGATHCLFQTTNGVNVSGTNASVITAVGNFTSGCPTGGGDTPPAAVTLSVTPSTIQLNDPALISWSATADICRYDGTSLPASVPGWSTSGDACIGASDCAAGGNVSQSFSVGGNYTFKLTCTSGASGQQQQTTAVQVKSLDVQGGTPPTACVAPAGLTRQLTGTISRPSTADMTPGADLTSWGNTFGWYFYTTGEHFTWPGIVNNNIKFYIQENHYIALEFTVPNDFPLYDGIGQELYGSMNQNASWIYTGPFTVTISQECGDFSPPAVGEPNYYCYRELSGSQGAVGWAVRPQGSGPTGLCPLAQGETYFLNITPAPLGQPTQGADDCASNSCAINLNNGGFFSADDYDPIP